MVAALFDLIKATMLCDFDSPIKETHGWGDLLQAEPAENSRYVGHVDCQETGKHGLRQLPTPMSCEDEGKPLNGCQLNSGFQSLHERARMPHPHLSVYDKSIRCMVDGPNESCRRR